MPSYPFPFLGIRSMICSKNNPKLILYLLLSKILYISDNFWKYKLLHVELKSQ